MRNKGLTLTELITTIAISSLIVLTITIFFVNEHRFRNMIYERVAPSREARMALNHMTRVLRFAIPTETITTGQGIISATIADEHLDFITSDTIVTYRSTAEHILEYIQGGTTFDVARYIKDLETSTEDTDGDTYPDYIIIKVEAKKKNRSVSIQTKIKILGD